MRTRFMIKFGIGCVLFVLVSLWVSCQAPRESKVYPEHKAIGEMSPKERQKLLDSIGGDE